MENRMIFNAPAKSFTDGFPIGNGRLAAMVISEESSFRIALNHEWLWSTDGRERHARKSSSHLEEVRSAILKGDHARGTQLANEYFSGKKGEKGKLCSYLPAGDLNISLNGGKVSGFKRVLKLDSGYVETVFRSESYGKVKTRAFTDICGTFGAFHIECENEAEMSVALTRSEDEKAFLTKETVGDLLVLGVTLSEDYRYNVYCRIIVDDGAVRFEFDKAIISGKRATLLFDVETEKDTVNIKDRLLFANGAFDEALKKHKRKFSETMGKTDITLEGAKCREHTVTERLNAFKNGKDIGFPILYWQFAKYLLISGSSGELPLNLQGKWNEDIVPMWHCDYHFDINLQMCYWAAPVLNMKKQLMPFFSYVEGCVESAAETAKNLYACRGICMALCSDGWGKTTPESYGWDVWVGAAPWLAAHFYDYYEYTLDEDFLRERAYPFIKRVAEFVEDYLIIKDGKAVIVPSCSPENHFEESGEFPISMCKNSVMDITLFKEALTNAAAAARILGVDGELAEKWQSLCKLLPEISVGESGRLLEWDKEYTEWEKGHRHFSHLYGLYPGKEINAGTTLADAAERSLEYRLSNGAGQSSWSRSWSVCLYARLKNGVKAWENLKTLFSNHIADSLLSYHPPCGNHVDPIFQIDGNMGGAASICEMLLQSKSGTIELLPAIPPEWKNGSFSGFRAKGAITVSARWDENEAVETELFSEKEQTVEIVLGNRRKSMLLPAGKTVKFSI